MRGVNDKGMRDDNVVACPSNIQHREPLKSCSPKHRSKWSTVESSVGSDGDDSMYSKVNAAAIKRNEAEMLNWIAAYGDLVAVVTIYHRRKGYCLKYIADVYTSNDQ